MAAPVALITGGARRIGRSTALALGRAGYRVAIHYGSSKEEAEQTAAEAGDGRTFQANLESVAEIQRLFSQVADWVGGLDLLVNNAARFTRFDPLDITEADWDFIHSVNLKASFFCAQQAARLMLAGEGGRIVNISSMGGLRAWPQHAHYCASKAGLIHLTKALAVAWAPRISVNSVAPGVIPFEEAAEAGIQALAAKTPARRAGTGDDIASAVLYFAQAPQFITGQVLAVDGGLTLV
jgi:3-oxoacyl-[acyl-carrier protein] reductase/pteridine reductase